MSNAVVCQRVNWLSEVFKKCFSSEVLMKVFVADFGDFFSLLCFLLLLFCFIQDNLKPLFVFLFFLLRDIF